MTSQRKKLIEVALPLDAINVASAREKSIRHGHPSTLHLWWARRPLAAARAVIFAQMVDDPSSYPDLFPTEKAQEKERQRLFRIIEALVKWENTTNEKVLQAARDEIWQSWRRACAENADHPRARELFDRHKLPAFHDPFAGGGSLPLEAQRLGLEAYASDLNPVAVLINKAMIEIPPKFAARPPVSLGPRASSPPSLQEQLVPTDPTTPTRPWNSRGYLPHFDQPGLTQSITFRLADSVPAATIAQWRDEIGLAADIDADDPRHAELRDRLDRFEDAGHGACHLRREDVATIVEDALIHFDGERYRLLAWCIMPNHVHALVETVAGHALSAVVHSWKSFTANAINRLIGTKGRLWMPDYHDRFVRDDRHFKAVVEYIENNPVKAGLVDDAEGWRYSSAFERAGSLRSQGAVGDRRGDGGVAGGGRAGSPRSQAIFAREWRGAQGLAEDVRYYGKWMRDEAEKRIGHLYPKIEITAEMAAERPDLQKYVGQKLTVIAWLWARTVKSPNPAFAQVDVPLASTFMLSTKPGKEAYVEPLILPGTAGFQPAKATHLPKNPAAETTAAPGYRFTVKIGKPADAEAAKNGTKLSRGANFQCVMSGTPITGDYIKAEGKAGRMGARLMAIVAEGDRGRVYLAPTEAMEAVAREARPEWRPDVEFFQQALGFRVGNYGMTRWSDLFTDRQLVALTTFTDLVQEARERVKQDAIATGLPDDGNGIARSGTGATAYADAVGVYLAFAVSKAADRNSSLCVWESTMDRMRGTFGRPALPVVWDYVETNPFAGAGGDIYGTTCSLCEALDRFSSDLGGHVEQADASSQLITNGKIVSTDPPYYDNIGYADLSDFFYVWLRRSLKPIFPDLLATLAVPKSEELVATPYRHDGKAGAEAFFLAGMTQAMHSLAEQAHPAFPVTIYYAFKQSETLGPRASSPQAGWKPAVPGHFSTGWETFLDAVIRAGFAVTGTWPIRTELGNRMRGMDSNALASSIILVCRPRPADAPTATRREFVAALKAELPAALANLQRGNIAPVDLAQAAIGPGMAVYTRYARVLDAAGKPLAVREALALINQTLDEALAEQEGDFDADTRWAVAWFEHAGFAEGEYGVAETLSKAKNTSVQGMVEAGFMVSRAGKVWLLRPAELPADWDPATDPRLTVWEMVHHLVRVLESGGEVGAAAVVAALGARAEVARELAYRLYTACERKKRAAEALSYNALVQSWPEIARLAVESGRPRAGQAALFGEE